MIDYLFLLCSIHCTSLVAQMVKNPPANEGDTGDPGLILGSGRSPGGGNGNPFQYSCLENSVDRGAWWTTVHGVAKSQTQLKLLARVHASDTYSDILYSVL